MNIADLPQDAAGTTWFWGLLKPGETGVNLACRCPPVPEDLDLSTVERWTKVCSGEHPIVLIMAKIDGKPRVFSFAEGVDATQEE